MTQINADEYDLENNKISLVCDAINKSTLGRGGSRAAGDGVGLRVKSEDW